MIIGVDFPGHTSSPEISVLQLAGGASLSFLARKMEKRFICLLLTTFFLNKCTHFPTLRTNSKLVCWLNVCFADRLILRVSLNFWTSSLVLKLLDLGWRCRKSNKGSCVNGWINGWWCDRWCYYFQSQPGFLGFIIRIKHFILIITARNAYIPKITASLTTSLAVCSYYYYHGSY